jgi:Bacteriophage HK97-gp10, putative tail-component
MPMTGIDDIQKEIMKQLKYYADDVKTKVKEAQEEEAKKLVAELKSTSPKGKRKSKKYSKGWAIKRFPKKLVVYNKQYQLTHLLEHGHVIHGGAGRTAAQIHIAPAEDRMISSYLSKIERAIEE